MFTGQVYHRTEFQVSGVHLGRWFISDLFLVTLMNRLCIVIVQVSGIQSSLSVKKDLGDILEMTGHLVVTLWGRTGWLMSPHGTRAL